MTTNLPFENWTEVLGSERLTGAALDRLTHRCHILETRGESYRLQDSKRRRKTQLPRVRLPGAASQATSVPQPIPFPNSPGASHFNPTLPSPAPPFPPECAAIFNRA